jgi:hypothetical protein
VDENELVFMMLGGVCKDDEWMGGGGGVRVSVKFEVVEVKNCWNDLKNVGPEC